MPAHENADLFNTTFRDEDAREWTIRLSVPLVHRFCAQERLTLAQFQPHLLDAAQLATLAYEGTRYQSRATANPETLEQWLEHLEGTSYLAMQEAAVEAVLFFTLRMSHQPEALPAALAGIREVQQHALEAMGLHPGGGATPGASAASPASTPPSPAAD
jgi:hypothetical protein